MRLPESLLVGGPWVIVALVQVTLVALVGCLAWLLARRRGPALRAAILLATLVGVLLTPIVASVAPVWLSLPEWACLAGAELPATSSDAVPVVPPARGEDPVALTLLVAQPPAREMTDPEQNMKQADDDTVPVKLEAALLDLDPPPEEALPQARPSAPPRPSGSVAGLLGAVWLLGAGAFVLRALVRLALLYHRARRARPIRNGAWTECMATLAQRHGLPAVALRESRHIAAPVTLGLFRPVILLPRGRRTWSAEQRALILEHELAHIRRHDFLAGLLAELVVCLCWLHPLMRWLTSRLRLEQEYAADAWVAATATNPTDYVRCLARLALELDRGHGLLAPAFWRRRPEILRRIDMLRRNPRGLPARLGTRAGWLVALLTAAACLAVGGVGRLQSAADGQKATASVPDAQSQTAVDRQGDPLPAGARARLGTTRMRHGGEIIFVAFGPGGKTLLTAGRDNTIRLWDSATRKEVRRFAVPVPVPVKKPADKGKKVDANEAFIMMMAGGGNDTGSVRIAATTDGKTLAVGRGNVIQLYDVETGDSLRKIQSEAGSFLSLLFAPDGKTLAARGPGGSFFLWATDTGKEISHIKSPQRPRNDNVVFIIGGGDTNAPGMAFTPDGKTLATAATDSTKEGQVQSVKLWEVSTGKEIRRIKAPGNVGVVAIAPDGETLAYGIGNTLHLCALKTGKETRQITTTGGRILSVAFTPDGKTLAIRGRNQRASLWDTQTGKELHTLSDAQPVPQAGGLVFTSPGAAAPETRALALSADGKRVVTAAGSTIRVWDTATGKELPLTEGHRKAPSMIAVSKDGKTVVSWGGDRVVRRWEAATGKLLNAFPAPERTTRAAFSRSGRTAALANADGTIRIHDTATGKERLRLKGPANGTNALAFAPDGKVLAARGGDNNINLYDADTGRELRHIALRPQSNPNQNLVLVLGGGGGGGNTGAGVAFSPDGKLLVTRGPGGGNSGNNLALIDTTSGKVLRKVELSQPASSLAFSPDGRTLATENADRTITLWEVASGKKRAQLGKTVAEGPRPRGRGGNVAFVVNGMGGGGGDPAGPVGLAFSPDGRALVARGADLSVRVWDVTAGKVIGQLKGHEGRIETVAFAPDGKSLASGATDTTILLWDASSPLKELARTKQIELPNAELETIWSDLAGTDAQKALEGVQRLAAAPKQAVSFLREQLKPAVRIDPRKIEGWIGDLESEKYAVRRAAADSLIRTGEQAVPALHKALAASPPLETRKRLEELVDKLTGGTLSTRQLQLVRAVEALERMGTPQARDVLRTLAKGAPGTLPTREAEAVLQRLSGSSARP